MKTNVLIALLLMVISSLVLSGLGPCTGERFLSSRVEGTGLRGFNTKVVPQWSPDGSRLLFAGDGIHVVYSDGSSLVDISRPDDLETDLGHFVVDYWPNLSPDGERIVYSTWRHTHWGRNNYELQAYALEGPGFRRFITTSQSKRLTRSSEEEGLPVWSPQGDRIAFFSDHDVVTIAPSGSDRRVVASTRSFFLHNPKVPPPVWSPDGKSIAFVARVLVDDVRTKRYAVFVAAADGSGVRELSQTGSLLGFRESATGYEETAPPVQPAWSPDGRRIAFAKFEDDVAGVYTIAPDGTDLRAVMPDIGVIRESYWEGNLSWSPDGSEILLGSAGYKWYEYSPLQPHRNLIIKSDGSGFRELPGPGGYSSWSPDGSRIAVRPLVNEFGIALYTMANDGSDGRVLVTEELQEVETPQHWIEPQKAWVPEAAGGVPLDELIGSAR